MVPKGGKINNFVDFSLKAYSGALGIWLLSLIFHTASKREGANYQRKLGFLWSIPQKKAVKVAEAKKTTHYLKILHFWIYEVKEAVGVIEAVEVIMADGAKEATEVIRFT